MNNKKILLVGGCGFIGHNLAIYLKKLGANPIVIDSLTVNNILSISDKEIINKIVIHIDIKQSYRIIKKRYKTH